MKSDEVRSVLKTVEDKLKKQHSDIQTTAANDVVLADLSRDVIYNRQVNLKKIPFDMRDDEDVKKLIEERMGLNISVKSF